MQVDREWSRRIVEQLGAEAEEWQQYAFWALNEIPELADAVYVEGYAVYDGPAPPTKHAWIEASGTILDPSPLLVESVRAQYFPGLRFTRQQIRERVGETGMLPPFYQYGWGGFDSPEMMRAGALAAEAIGWKHLAQHYWQHYVRARALRDEASRQG